VSCNVKHKTSVRLARPLSKRTSSDAEGVTHLQLEMKPDKGGAACRVTLTALVLKSAEN
jgi:hypothetical protein